MSANDTVKMSPDERDAFLGVGGTGVISFQTAGRDPPYALPVSYGYDAETGSFYFRLAFPSGAGKEAGLHDRPVTFVVYGEVEGEWCSVVASGELTEVAEADVGTEILDGMRRIHIPLYDVFDADHREIPFRFFYLDPTDLTARRETTRPE